MKLYGIVNCDTVKTARRWLDAHGKRYDFVDLKKLPPTRELLESWCAKFGWENVLNRRGTTWRLLSPEVQAHVKNERSAIALMLEKPSAIKRPVLENPHPNVLGFDKDAYEKL